MHEDIDDYKPDWDDYYRYDADLKKHYKQKYYWSEKYFDGKITYEKYLNGLESNFYEILELNEWQEIKDFKEKENKKKEIENQKKAAESYRREQEREELKKNLAMYFWILMLIVFLISLLK